jgi:hypothetical protein
MNTAGGGGGSCEAAITIISFISGKLRWYVTHQRHSTEVDYDHQESVFARVPARMQ